MKEKSCDFRSQSEVLFMKKESLFHAVRLWVALAGALVLLPFPALAQSTLTGIADTSPHAPLAGGSLAYNGSPLSATQGASYVDPVFKTTVRRLTTDHVSDDI